VLQKKGDERKRDSREARWPPPALVDADSPTPEQAHSSSHFFVKHNRPPSHVLPFPSQSGHEPREGVSKLGLESVRGKGESTEIRTNFSILIRPHLNQRFSLRVSFISSDSGWPESGAQFGQNRCLFFAAHFYRFSSIEAEEKKPASSHYCCQSGIRDTFFELRTQFAKNATFSPMFPIELSDNRAGVLCGAHSKKNEINFYKRAMQIVSYLI